MYDGFELYPSHFWCLSARPVTCGDFCCGVVLASIQRRFGFVLMSFSPLFNIASASLCHDFGLVLTSFWPLFVMILASFKRRFGLSLAWIGPCFNVVLESVSTTFENIRAVNLWPRFNVIWPRFIVVLAYLWHERECNMKHKLCNLNKIFKSTLRYKTHHRHSVEDMFGPMLWCRQSVSRSRCYEQRPI